MTILLITFCLDFSYDFELMLGLLAYFPTLCLQQRKYFSKLHHYFYLVKRFNLVIQWSFLQVSRKFLTLQTSSSNKLNLHFNTLHEIMSLQFALAYKLDISSGSSGRVGGGW